MLVNVSRLSLYLERNYFFFVFSLKIDLHLAAVCCKKFCNCSLNYPACRCVKSEFSPFVYAKIRCIRKCKFFEKVK